MPSPMSFTRPRRSALYMPADNPRALAKAKSLAADCLIFDLEDGVLPPAKQTAREHLHAFFADTNISQNETGEASETRAQSERMIRINAQASEFFADDIKLIKEVKPDAVLLPKITNARDIKHIYDTLGADVALWAMIETPAAILALGEIAACATTMPLTGLIIGSNDLIKDMQADFMPHRANLQTALSLTILAARASGLIALDGVFNEIGDMDGFMAECRQARDFGFDGKTLIHPKQIAPANEIFAPSADEIKQAEAIVAAFQDKQNQGQSVLVVDGKMTEYLHFERAQRILQKAALIATLAPKSRSK